MRQGDEGDEREEGKEEKERGNVTGEEIFSKNDEPLHVLAEFGPLQPQIERRRDAKEPATFVSSVLLTCAKQLCEVPSNVINWKVTQDHTIWWMGSTCDLQGAPRQF